MKYLVESVDEKKKIYVSMERSLTHQSVWNGAPFDVFTSEDGENWTKEVARILYQGRCLMLGNRITRTLGSVTKGKRGKALVQSGSAGEVARLRNLICKPIRPVEPKVTAASLGLGDLKSPMTGKILNVLVENGQSVKEGDVLLVIEAMKMENKILAEGTGLVDDIQVSKGAMVNTDDTLLTLKAEKSS